MNKKRCKVCDTTDNVLAKRNYCNTCWRELEKLRYKETRDKILLHRKTMYNAENEREYYLQNKEKINKRNNEYKKKRLANDPLYRLKENTKMQIKKCITKQGYTKDSNTYNIIGCTYDELIQYLESQFKSWMNWTNYGLYEKGKYNVGWDIDHIIPLSSAKNKTELYKLFHHTNLQPLCSKVNRDEKKAKQKIPTHGRD